MLFGVSISSICFGDAANFEFPDLQEALKFITNAMLRYRDSRFPHATLQATIKIIDKEDK